MTDGILSPQHHVAADMLVERMRLAFAQNPRGEKYRTLDNGTLLRMLKQNVDKLDLAMEYGNDVEDKLADVANYCAFLYRNHVDPPATGYGSLTTSELRVPQDPDKAHELLGLLLMEHPFLNGEMDKLITRIGTLDDDYRPFPQYLHLYKAEELDEEGRVRRLLDTSTFGQESGTTMVQGPLADELRVTHPEDDGLRDDRGKVRQEHPAMVEVSDTEGQGYQSRSPRDTDGTGRDQGQWTPDYRWPNR